MRSRTRRLKVFCAVLTAPLRRRRRDPRSRVPHRQGRDRPAPRWLEATSTPSSRWREHRDGGQAQDGATSSIALQGRTVNDRALATAGLRVGARRRALPLLLDPGPKVVEHGLGALAVL